MKRYTLTFVVALVLMLAVAGCSLAKLVKPQSPPTPEATLTTAPVGPDTPEPFTVELLGHSNGVTFFRDTVTDVMYLRSANSSGSNLTVMLDPDTGLPVTYSSYMERYQQSVPPDPVEEEIAKKEASNG